MHAFENKSIFTEQWNQGVDVTLYNSPRLRLSCSIDCVSAVRAVPYRTALHLVVLYLVVQRTRYGMA
jgi:hypothetical protein